MADFEKTVEKIYIGDIEEILPTIDITAGELAGLEPSTDMLEAAGIFPENTDENSNKSRLSMLFNKAVNYIANRWQGFLSLFTKE